MDTHRPSDATLDTNPNPGPIVTQHKHIRAPKQRVYLLLRLVTGIVGLIAFAIFVDFHVKRDKLLSSLRCLNPANNPSCYYTTLRAFQQPWWPLAMTASVASFLTAFYDLFVQFVLHQTAPLQHTIILLDLIIVGASAGAAASLQTGDIWRYAGPDGSWRSSRKTSDLTSSFALLWVMFSFHVFMVLAGAIYSHRRRGQTTETVAPTAETRKEINRASWVPPTTQPAEARTEMNRASWADTQRV